jgi:hypothetical protein
VRLGELRVGFDRFFQQLRRGQHVKRAELFARLRKIAHGVCVAGKRGIHARFFRRRESDPKLSPQESSGMYHQRIQVRLAARLRHGTQTLAVRGVQQMNVPLNAGMIRRAGYRVGAGNQNVRAEKFTNCRNLIVRQGVGTTSHAEVLLHLVHSTRWNESHLAGVELRPQTIRQNVAKGIGIFATGEILKTENRDGLASTRGGLLRGGLPGLCCVAIGYAPTELEDSECCKDEYDGRDRHGESPAFESHRGRDRFSAQGSRDVFRACKAAFGRTLQAARHHGLPARVEIGNVQARRRRDLIQAFHRGGQRRVGGKRQQARQHFVDDDAERINIGSTCTAGPAGSNDAFVSFNEVGNTSTIKYLGGAGAPPTFYFWTTDGNLTGLAPVTSGTAPEPAGLLLLASGLVGIMLLRRRTVQS